MLALLGLQSAMSQGINLLTFGGLGAIRHLLGIRIVQPEGSMHHQTSQCHILVHQIL
jgi:hypothetical protein